MMVPDVYVPIIRKNTPIPIKPSEVFYTIYPNQEAVEVNIFQGEDSDARKNIELGKFTVHGLSEGPENNEIIITFSLDVNGILQVEAMEKRTGLAKSITLENAFSRFENEELDSARKRIDQLFGDQSDEDRDNGREDTEAVDIQENDEAVIAKARALLDTVEEDDREDIVELLEEIQDARTAGDTERCNQAVEELSAIIFYLEN